MWGGATSPRWLKGQGTTRRAVVMTLSCMVLSLLVVLSINASLAYPASGVLSQSHETRVEAPVLLVTDGTAQTSSIDYCGLLGPNPGTSAGLPTYTRNVSALWNETCILPSFIQTINRWGNLYLTYTGGSNNSTYWASGNLTVSSEYNGHKIPSVQFGVFFSAPCTNVTGGAGLDCSYDTYWNGNVSTNEAAGPFTTEFLCPGCHFIGPPPPGSAGGGPSFPAGWLLGAAMAAGAALAAVYMARRSHSPSTPKPEVKQAEGAGRAPPVDSSLGRVYQPPRPDRSSESPERDGLDDML
jgi:hypothetical protein